MRGSVDTKAQIRTLRKAARAALPLLRAIRASLIECHSLLDKKTGAPIPETLEANVADEVAAYGRAISLCERGLGKR